MMMLNTKNEKAPASTRQGRVAPQRSWKSSSDLPQRGSVDRWASTESLSSVASSTNSGIDAPPMRPPKRYNSNSSSEVDLDQFDATDHGDDVDSSDDGDQEPISPLKGDRRAADLSGWKSSDSLARLHGTIPSSRPSRQGPSSPTRGGLARWKSTSECLQRSSIPEDSELLTICKKHPADDTKDEDDSLTKPKRRNSITQNEAPEEDESSGVANDFASDRMPTPVMLMRRHRSEVPSRGHNSLLEMQQSLRQGSPDVLPEAPAPSTSRKAPPSRSGSSRPTPPRRLPSRSVSEYVKPLQRSLSRQTSIQRRPSSNAAGGELMALRKAAAADTAQSMPSPVSVQDVRLDAESSHI